MKVSGHAGEPPLARLWLSSDAVSTCSTRPTGKTNTARPINGNSVLTVAVPLGQTNAAKTCRGRAGAPARRRLRGASKHGLVWRRNGRRGGERDVAGAAGGHVSQLHRESQAGQVLVAWETLSEVDTAGFNLYRSLSEGGERTLLAAVPAQGPGSPAGTSYSYRDRTCPRARRTGTGWSASAGRHDDAGRLGERDLPGADRGDAERGQRVAGCADSPARRAAGGPGRTGRAGRRCRPAPTRLMRSVLVKVSLDLSSKKGPVLADKPDLGKDLSSWKGRF